jgi:hypothetical protein
METKLRTQIKRLIILFIIGLVLSGITAFPIELQLGIANQWITYLKWDNGLTQWVELVYKGITETNAKYPFIAYGTDWLAFAHLVIAVAFTGPLRDPVKNIWVIEFGMIACIAIFPLAFIAGAVRGIPFYWRLIDCSFGIFGGILLWICYRKIKTLERITL